MPYFPLSLHHPSFTVKIILFMKKNLHLSLTSVFIILFSIKALAIDVRQTWTWTGANGNLWADGGNWTASPTDPSQTYPHNYDNGFGKIFIADVVFNGSATPSIAGTYFVNSLAINSGTVNLVSSGSTRTFYISNAASGASMTINSGATLQLGDASLGLIFEINTNGIVGTISGTLDLSGNGNSSNAPKFQNYGTACTSVTTVTSSGKVILSGSNAQVLTMRNTNFVFQSGAQLNITRNGGTVPGADYQSGSVINVT